MSWNYLSGLFGSPPPAELSAVVEEATPLREETRYMERAWQWVKPSKCSLCGIIRGVSLVTTVFSGIVVLHMAVHHDGSQEDSRKIVIAGSICAGSLMMTSFSFSTGSDFEEQE